MEEDLINSGENATTTVFWDNRRFEIVSYPQRGEHKIWSQEEIIELLNDGMKYRFLKKAKKLEV